MLSKKEFSHIEQLLKNGSFEEAREEIKNYTGTHSATAICNAVVPWDGVNVPAKKSQLDLGCWKALLENPFLNTYLIPKHIDNMLSREFPSLPEKAKEIRQIIIQTPAFRNKIGNAKLVEYALDFTMPRSIREEFAECIINDEIILTSMDSFLITQIAVNYSSKISKILDKLFEVLQLKELSERRFLWSRTLLLKLFCQADEFPSEQKDRLCQFAEDFYHNDARFAREVLADFYFIQSTIVQRNFPTMRSRSLLELPKNVAIEHPLLNAKDFLELGVYYLVEPRSPFDVQNEAADERIAIAKQYFALAFKHGIEQQALDSLPVVRIGLIKTLQSYFAPTATQSLDFNELLFPRAVVHRSRGNPGIKGSARYIDVRKRVFQPHLDATTRMAKNERENLAQVGRRLEQAPPKC